MVQLDHLLNPFSTQIAFGYPRAGMTGPDESLNSWLGPTFGLFW
jgi:hypothetical protein